MDILSFSVRYIVNDVPAAINFYSKLLGFNDPSENPIE